MAAKPILIESNRLTRTRWLEIVSHAVHVVSGETLAEQNYEQRIEVSAELGFAAGHPLRVEPRPIVKRFLRSHAGGGEAGVKVGAPHRLPLGKPLPKKNGETSDEGIAGSGAVDTFHRKCWQVFHAFLPRQQ